MVEKKGRYAREMTALYFHLPKNMKLVGDSAYGDQLDKVIITKDAHKPTTAKLSVTMKSLHGSTFMRFKDFWIIRKFFLDVWIVRGIDET